MLEVEQSHAASRLWRANSKRYRVQAPKGNRNAEKHGRHSAERLQSVS